MRGKAGDLQRLGDDWALLIRGKIHDHLMFLRHDVAISLRGYLLARSCVVEDADGEPLSESEQNRGRGTTGERATGGMMARCLSRPRTLSLWGTSCASSCAVSAR
jgi:hypothetical protein